MRRILLSLMLLLAPVPPALPASLVGPDAVPDPGPAREAAMLVERGELDAAEQIFRELHALSPLASLPYLGLAEVAARRGDAAEAERRLRAGLEGAPQATELWRALGRLRAAQDDRAGTEAAFGEARRRRPAEAANAHEFAELLHEHFGDAAAALPLYEAAQRLAPGDWRPRHGRGVALARLGQQAAALDALREAELLAPGSPVPPYARGQVLAGLNRPAEAEAALREGERRGPGWAAPPLALGSLLLGGGRPAEAEAAFRRAAAAGAAGAAAPLGLALAREAQGDLAGAEALYREAIGRDAGSPVALNNLAWAILRRGGDAAEAATLAGRAAAILPGEPSVLTTLGRARELLGDAAGAEAALVRAAAAAPTADRLAWLGEARLARGEAAGAIEAFRRALVLDARHAGARAGLRRAGGG